MGDSIGKNNYTGLHNKYLKEPLGKSKNGFLGLSLISLIFFLFKEKLRTREQAKEQMVKSIPGKVPMLFKTVLKPFLLIN